MVSKSPRNTETEKETGDGLKSLSNQKMTPEQQSALFIKTARKLECDESGESFEKAIRKIL